MQPVEAGKVPFWRRALSFLGTGVAVVSVALLGMGLASLPAVQDIPNYLYTWHIVGYLASPIAGLVMILRIRKPELTMLLSSGFAILLPISPLGPAIALPWVLGNAPRKAWTWAIPLGVVATAVPMWRDWKWQGPGSLFSNPRTGELNVDGLSYALMWATLFAISLAGGWVRYYRGRVSRESSSAEAHRAQVEYLRTELGRQEERDLIAHEMHDTVAHHLSLVSLHAGALEVTTTDEAVPEVARAVRESAHLALEEMRSLISSLRDSAADGYAGAAPLLSQWEELVQTAQNAGVEIRAEVDVDTANMPASLARAAYRILQESITNAAKHAPGLGVSIWIWGGPAEGVHIIVVNWLPPDTSRFGPPRPEAETSTDLAGMGILGMMERARALTGTLSAGPVDGRWVVQAWMPWK